MKQNNNILILIFIIIFILSLYYLFRINKCNDSYQELLTNIQSNNIEYFNESACARLESPKSESSLVSQHSDNMYTSSHGDSGHPETSEDGKPSAMYSNDPKNKKGTLSNPGGKCNPNLPPSDYHSPNHLKPQGHPDSYKSRCKNDTGHPKLPQFPPHIEVINADCDMNPNSAVKDCVSRCRNFNPYHEMKHPDDPRSRDPNNEKDPNKSTLPPCKIIPPPVHPQLLSTTENEEIPVHHHPHSNKTMPPVKQESCPPCQTQTVRPFPHELIKHANKHLELLKAKKKQLACTPKPFIPQGLSPSGQQQRKQQQQQFQCPPVHSPEMLNRRKC